MISKGQDSSQHLRDVQEVFEQIIDQSELDTGRLLDELCAGNDTLRNDVQRLLAVTEKKLNGFMEAPADSVQLNGSFAGFTIVEPLGEGGMGAVYLAEQENPRRQVALKTLKSGFASAEVRRRFDYESQLLGELSHPGIAQVYEAGSATVT